MSEIQVGDVCLDLAQGRPVHVVEDTQMTAAEWSGNNGYDLEANYGNSRLGAGPNDRVFEVVYCSNLKSEPSKTYAFPESRLARVETESADDGMPVYDRVAVDVLKTLLVETDGWQPEDLETPRQMFDRVATEAFGEDVLSLASELADIERRPPVGGDGDA